MTSEREQYKADLTFRLEQERAKKEGPARLKAEGEARDKMYKEVEHEVRSELHYGKGYEDNE